MFGLSPLSFLTDWLLSPLINWLKEMMLDLVRVMLQMLIDTSNILLNSQVTIGVESMLQVVAFSMFGLGVVFAVQDYFNGIDNSNFQYANNNFIDMVIPVVFSSLYTSTFIVGAKLLFLMVTSFSTDILEAAQYQYTINYEMWKTPGFLESITNPDLSGIVIIIFLIVIIISAWDLFKEIVTKVPLLVLTMIVGSIKPFSIARGNVDEIVVYIKSVIGISLVLIIKLFFFTWGLAMILSPQSEMLILGIGLVIASKYVDNALGDFANTMGTQYGGRNAVSSTIRNLTMIKGL